MEESLLVGELSASMREMGSWTQSGDATVAKTRAPKNTGGPLAIRNTVEKPAAVVDYENFIAANGGTTGGWDDFDHQEFLAFRQRLGPLQGALVHQAIANIPTKSPSETIEHEVWYSQYTTLFAARKEAVAGWKRKKEEENEKTVQVQTVQAKRRDAAVQQMRQAAHEKQKARLAVQKAQKEKEEEARRVKMLQTQKEQDEQNREKFQEHQAQLKQKLDQHYGKLDEQITALQMKEAQKLEEVRERHQLANSVVHQLGERELHKVEEKFTKRQQEKAQKEREILKKEEYVEGLRRKVLEKVGRKPERLTKPTSGWNNRLRSTRAARRARKQSMERVLQNWQTPTSIFDLAKLGVPLWRKEPHHQLN
ncbi:hypothetical protein RvY_16702 [Ramazzottius varieornatus]|uniref:Coiled-coil domain-containing protein 112 n=1 Tax=Ramazzottius varieornatus TaxID=947166 RepID=A0A1D1W051_RAMVA|nr:hypothetical protein RvY_16702 [Ramazzottius varieornatus]